MVSIRAKNQAVFRACLVKAWHPRLIDVYLWISEHTDMTPVITSAYRPGGGVHGTDPLRAVDLRSRGLTDPMGIAAAINLNWHYGDDRHEVCVYHQIVTCSKCGERHSCREHIPPCPNCGNTHGISDGLHFHVQVRNETESVTCL